jgi:hypothetical protein
MPRGDVGPRRTYQMSVARRGRGGAARGEESTFFPDGAPEGFSPPPDPSGPATSSLGIGVAGRALDGHFIGHEPSLETLFPFSIGVLGHSSNGVGIRGHGGFPLANIVIEDVECSFRQGPGPGAVFSAGRLIDLETDNLVWAKTISPNGPRQTMSADFLPQLRLIPTLFLSAYQEIERSERLRALPAVGNLGDIFVAAGPLTNNNQKTELHCQMFMCVQPGNGSAANSTHWRRFLLDEVFEIKNAAELCVLSPPPK